MFCSECGAKNKKDSIFCEKCGAKIEQEHEEVEEKKSTKKVSKDTSPSQDKRKKITIIAVCAAVVLLIVVYSVLNNMTSPKGVVKDYISAYANENYGKLYKYVSIDGDDTFASKDKFVSQMEKSMKDTNIANYNVTDVKVADSKLTAVATVKYTLEGSDSEKTMTINLVKQKNKKWLVFDNWEISDLDTATVKDYSIKVLKGSTLKIEDKKVDSKYLDKDKSDKTYDVYKIPAIFAVEYKISAETKNGMKLEDKVSPSKYYNSTSITPNEKNLSSDTKKDIINDAKKVTETMYKSAISNTAFADTGLDKKHETFYVDFLSDMTDSTTTLKAITIEDLSMYDFYMNTKGEANVIFTMKCKYTISYKSWLSDTEETKDNSSDSMRVKATYDYKDGKFILSGITYLATYFSRY